MPKINAKLLHRYGRRYFQHVARNKKSKVVPRAFHSKVDEEISRCQRASKFMIPRAPMKRVISKITRDSIRICRLTKDAYDAIQCVAEDEISFLFEISNFLAAYSKRSMVTTRDLRAALYLKKRFTGQY
jgi:histone H3/H4